MQAGPTTATNSFIALPEHGNSIGTIFGGTILKEMDMVAAICARRFCHKRVSTVAVDDVRIFKALTVGLVVKLDAQITRSFTTSMEIKISVTGQNTYSGEEFLAAQAYFTLVGLDENNRPTKIPEYSPVGKEEKSLWEQAKIRQGKKKTA